MQTTIQQKLCEIEAAEQVRILYACESGSRAWGFASPDSDYDVRFIYVRPRAEYLRLNPLRDVIEWQLDDTLDINGWDLQKTLRLLLRSNPTIFEWNSSPICYRETPLWTELRPVISSYFQSNKGMLHYLAMARDNATEYLSGETVRRKKYFYVLRPILACRWILKRGTPPPMAFPALCAAELPEALRPMVDTLLAEKIQTSEAQTCARIEPLHAFITSELHRLQAEIGRLPSKLLSTPPNDASVLDAIFLRALE